jgi:YidC/Oxa1 family membrane protein insertase
MDKRTLLAFALMALVIVVTPMIFKSPSRTAIPPRTDSTKVVTSSPPTVVEAPPVSAVPPSPGAPAATARAVVSDTTTVDAPSVKLTLASAGAVPLSVQLKGYRDLRPGVRDTMVLRQAVGPLLHYRLALGRDTVNLDTVAFSRAQNGGVVKFTSNSPPIAISYSVPRDGFASTVRGSVANAPANSALLIDLPQGLETGEADTTDDQRHLAYGYKLGQRDPSSVSFGKLDPATTRADSGDITWVAARTKYFLVALLRASDSLAAKPFRMIAMRGAPRIGKTATHAMAVAVQPLTADGHFGFELYMGPQSWEHLHAAGHELENVNPYAGWLHGIVQPFSTIIMRVLLWMKRTLSLNYGWVLVIFGVAIRLLLWPLNQKAMRTSIAMQRLQPELAEVQKKYKNDPEKQRDALVKLYQSHGMSPLSPLLGCMPMLLPMPVLFALYFVFQNTIEFRGVSFLWLPDISLRDPYFITPLAMGVSMFVLSWLGMRAAPPNPQTKMMSYMMPVMFTVMFLNFAAGLNLYYAVQNIAALPQQWLLSRERQRSGLAPAPTPQRR